MASSSSPLSANIFFMIGKTNLSVTYRRSASDDHMYGKLTTVASGTATPAPKADVAPICSRPRTTCCIISCSLPTNWRSTVSFPPVDFPMVARTSSSCVAP